MPAAIVKSRRTNFVNNPEYAHQYPTEADALRFDRANSVDQSVDGEWETIEIPSNWQLKKRHQGYDFPMYFNSGYNTFDHSTCPKNKTPPVIYA